MRIDYHPAIADELEEIRDHYEVRSTGLGRDFVDEFERKVLTIAAMPTRWMVASGGVRKSLMKRFLYVVLFRILADDTIRVSIVNRVF
jgi:toxin ParE1/3/4